MCHTLRVYSPPKVLLRPLSQIFFRVPKQYFVFVSCLKKTNPHSLQQSSKHCASIVQRTNCNVAFCFGAIVRKGACTVISRLVAHSVDIVAWPVHRRFAFCTSWKVSEVNLFNDRGEIISNLGYLTSFPRNQKQQCRNCLH